MLADRAYDARRFRETLTERGITPCIPPHAQRKIQHSDDRTLYRQRHRIETMFARLKIRYGRCAHTLLSAITLAATDHFRLNES